MAKVKTVIHHGNKRHMVDLGLVAGKRKRKFYQKAGEAKKELHDLVAERKELGEAWRMMTARQKWPILEILREIEESGTTLLEVWESWKAINLKKGGGGISIKDSIDQFLDLKKEAGRRPLYLREAGYGLRLFSKGREDRDLSSVQLGEVQNWLNSLEKSQATKQTLQSRLNSLFSWAVRQGYVSVNPIAMMEKISVTKADPEILEVEQCRRLVYAALQHDKGIAKYFALSLFLGVRPEECQRLPKDAIDLERMTVTVSGDAAKTRNRRIITINEPAFRILEKTAKEDYKVNFRKRLVAIRKQAKIRKWPKDVLRHTAASHMHNIYTIDEATKQLGHSADVMLRHYRQMVSKEETQEWLEI